MSEPSPKRPRGCLFYGCMSGIVVLVMLLVGLLVGLHFFKKMFNQLTDSLPAPLPPVTLSQTEVEQLRERVDKFRQEVATGHALEPLTLSADELNALIATDPQWRALKDKVYVSIDGNQLKGQLSVPLDQLGLPMFRNRYLNATGVFLVSLKNGALMVKAEDITVKGKPLPEVYMDKIRLQNLAQGANADPGSSNALSKLDEIKVQDGKLVIAPKVNQ